MLFMIIGLLMVVAAVVSGIVRQKLALVIDSLLAVLLLVVSLMTIVPTGFTGVLTTFGRVEDRSIEAGLNFKAPWQSIVLMDNREQKVPFTFSAFSSDIQQTSVTGSINFNIDKQTSMKLYKDIGTEYSNILIQPRLLENTKTIFSRYSAEDLISKRDTLATEIETLMRADLNEYGVNIVSISIEDIDFTDAFTNAIEAKTVAVQDKLRAETQQEQATMEAQAQAERQKIQAEANAEVAKVQANAEAEVAKVQADAEAYSIAAKAEAEAEANMKIAESLTESLIQYTEIEQWNGELPMYMGTGNAIPVIDVKDGE